MTGCRADAPNDTRRERSGRRLGVRFEVLVFEKPREECAGLEVALRALVERAFDRAFVQRGLEDVELSRVAGVNETGDFTPVRLGMVILSEAKDPLGPGEEG